MGTRARHKPSRLAVKLRQIRAFDLIVQILNGAPGHEVEEEVVLGQLALIFPNEASNRLLRTIVGWARYAELFNFDSNRRVLYSRAKGQ